MVTATDDGIYEVDSQIFTLNLALMNPSSSDIVLTNPSTATITVMDDEGKSKRYAWLDLLVEGHIIAIDAVVSMDTPTMTTTEGGIVDVCANLISPSGGTSVPITVVFTWSGGV